jgi:hypothetical protein
MRFRPLLALVGLLVTVVATAEAQNVGATPNFGDLRLKETFMPDPQIVGVTSGGGIDVNRGNCSYGYVSNAPDVDLYYTTSGGSGLYIYAEGDGDTMLLVNTPSGDWVCNDDDHGSLDPLLYFSGARDGLYNIWVGSYSNENHSATLYVSEINPDGGTTSSSSSFGTPDWTLDPTYGNVRLDQGFLPDPHAVSLRAGGSLEVDIGDCDYGYVADAPDVDFYYETSGNTTLYIYVDGGDDTTLLVNRPDRGWTCNDDGYTGSNPIVEISRAEDGLYNIYVGTYGDDVTNATLYISEIDPR